MIKAIIFDLDDTLISEKQYIISGFLHISKLLSKKLNKSQNEIYQHLIALFNKSPKNVFNRLYEELGLSYSMNDIDYLVEEYRNHNPSISFYEDVIPCLQELKRRSIKLGIITDGNASAQRKKLEAIDANKYFDEIIVTDDLGKEYWKPNPLSFQIMKEKLNVEFDEMIYVGDNPEKDFYISKIYPIKTARIIRDGIYKNRSYKDGVRENFLIKTLNELLYEI